VSLLTVRLACPFSVSVSAFLLFAFGLTGCWRGREHPADSLEAGSPSWCCTVLPGNCFSVKACAGWWLCPERSPSGISPFAQELETSGVTAQHSCHGELQLELGLALKPQRSLPVLSRGSQTLLGCCFRALFCRVLVNKYPRLTEKLCLYFHNNTDSGLLFKCQVS